MRHLPGLHHLPGSDLQMWRSSHSHSCEQCVPWSYTSQLNIMQTCLWWFHAADYIFDGLTSNRSSVWSKSFPRCDSSYAVSRLKPPNWGIYKAINQQLFSLRSSHTCLVIVYLFISSCGWWQWARKQEVRRLHLKRNLSHAWRLFFFFQISIWTEQLAFDGKPDVGMKWDNIYSVSFSSFGHPSLRLETVRAAERTGNKDDELLLGYIWGFFLPRDKSKASKYSPHFFPTWQNWFVFSGEHNSSCSAQTFKTGHELLPSCPSWGYHSKNSKQIGQNCLPFM